MLCFLRTEDIGERLPCLCDREGDPSQRLVLRVIRVYVLVEHMPRQWCCVGGMRMAGGL
jgi:hypothetical protein